MKGSLSVCIDKTIVKVILSQTGNKVSRELRSPQGAKNSSYLGLRLISTGPRSSMSSAVLPAEPGENLCPTRRR